jgi:hypothetical protein
MLAFFRCGVLECPSAKGPKWILILFTLSVNFLVAPRAKSYKIFYGIIPKAAPPSNVMDLKILHAPARLTSPAIALQNSLAELAISFGLKRSRIDRISFKA